MNSFVLALLALLLGGLIASAASPAVTEEVPLGFLPMEWVAAALQKTLSPQGRSVLVTPTGPVRITDQGDRIDAARSALDALQKAPALLPLDISFTTTSRREVQRLPVEPPVVNYGIPVPDRYDPPRIIQNGGGGFTIVPAQPRSFRTRNVGPGTVVNPSPTGYQTGNAEVRLTETVTSELFNRRFTASTVPGKPVLVTVLRQAPDAAALRALALKHRAISEAEPAWAAAGTELLVTPELSGGSLVVNIVPQIVLPAATPAQATRRIPISACSAGVVTARGASGQRGTLPRTDPEFYRLFLGAAQAADDTITAVTVAARVDYIGNAPK